VGDANTAGTIHVGRIMYLTMVALDDDRQPVEVPPWSLRTTRSAGAASRRTCAGATGWREEIVHGREAR
jgi:acyl-CoA hydrolase